MQAAAMPRRPAVLLATAAALLALPVAASAEVAARFIAVR
jgi:hypothetical protein